MVVPYVVEGRTVCDWIDGGLSLEFGGIGRRLNDLAGRGNQERLGEERVLHLHAWRSMGNKTGLNHKSKNTVFGEGSNPNPKMSGPDPPKGMCHYP